MAGRTELSRTLLIPLAAGLLLSTADQSAAEEWTVGPWEQTVYYHYQFEAAAATDGQIRITSVDEYELFVNGESVGSDASWESMEEYPVSLQRRDNYIGVIVTNRGRGEGTGLVVEVSTEEESWTSNTSGLEEVWRWTAQQPEDDTWLTADLSRDTAWVPVQRGYLDRTLITDWEDTLGVEVIAGFPGDVDIGRADGGLTLRSVEGENLALGKPSRRFEMFDGRPNTTWTINPDELNSAATGDLLQRRLVSSVRVLTAGDDPEEFAENSLLGYAVQVSNDGFQWAEVGVIHGINEFERTEMPIDPIFTRHVRMVVAEVDPFRRSKLAEIQVLGQGVAPAGTFTSEPLDLDLPGERKNFVSATWEADIPEATSVSLQFRSSDDAEEWSEWGEPILATEAEIVVPEPRSLLQYRVNLATEFEDVVPRFRTLTVEFNDDIPASQARGRVHPNAVVLGRDTLFTYELDLEFDDDDTGVERLRIETPSQAEIETVTLPDGVSLAETVALGDALEFTFAEPWRSSGTLTVSFRARLLTNQFAFTSRLFGPGASEALNAEEDPSVDDETGSPHSWRVRANDVSGALLSEVRANPAVLTPNGDNANEETIIELTLARVSEPQAMEIGIYDLNGRLVRELAVGRLTGGQYIRPPDGGAPAGETGLVWDGKDAGGQLVPPGLYLLRVSALLGLGDETVVRTIAVAY